MKRKTPIPCRQARKEKDVLGQSLEKKKNHRASLSRSPSTISKRKEEKGIERFKTPRSEESEREKREGVGAWRSEERKNKLSFFVGETKKKLLARCILGNIGGSDKREGGARKLPAP